MVKILKQLLNNKYGKNKGVLTMNNSIVDEKIVNQNETVENAMQVLKILSEGFTFKELSFYKGSNGEMRFRVEC